MARLNLGHWSFRFGQREAKGGKRVRMRFILHLRELSEERRRGFCGEKAKRRRVHHESLSSKLGEGALLLEIGKIQNNNAFKNFMFTRSA
jgi:hypothetical protein